MEGYLYIKIGRRFLHSYVVLEGQQLQYYEHVDTNSQLYKNCKGVQLVSNVSIHPFHEVNRPYSIAIVYPDGITTVIDCEQKIIQQYWIEALQFASSLHIYLNEKSSIINVYRSRLGIHFDESISLMRIKNAYRDACIDTTNLNHGKMIYDDNGFDINNLNHTRNLSKESIQTLLLATEAKTVLLWLENDTYKRSIGEVIDYEAVIIKDRDGEGLGIIVEEAPYLSHPRLDVVEISPTLQLKGLTKEANGSICKGDILIGIDQDNCSDWPLSRVRARLGALRLPPGHTVTLTFERVLLPSKPPQWTPRSADKINNNNTTTSVVAAVAAVAEPTTIVSKELKNTMKDLRHPLPQNLVERAEATLKAAKSSSNRVLQGINSGIDINGAHLTHANTMQQVSKDLTALRLQLARSTIDSDHIAELKREKLQLQKEKEKENTILQLKARIANLENMISVLALKDLAIAARSNDLEEIQNKEDIEEKFDQLTQLSEIDDKIDEANNDNNNDNDDMISIDGQDYNDNDDEFVDIPPLYSVGPASTIRPIVKPKDSESDHIRFFQKIQNKLKSKSENRLSYRL